jgi:glycosyltransferase involved in cell wall biosynthesis
MVLIGNIHFDGRVRKEIATLIKAGNKVDLIVSDYRKNQSGGEDLGVQIHYIPTKIWTNTLMNLWENWSFNCKAAAIIRKINPTHIHCHDLPSLASGVWAKKKTRSKLVFDAHELYPESWGGIKERIWEYIEKKFIKSCDSIIMPEKNRIAYFKKKYPEVCEPILLQNFPRKKDISTMKFDLFREKYPINREQKIILHTGYIAPGRNVEELVDSMTMCGSEFILILLGGARKNYDGYRKFLYTKINNYGLLNRVFIHESVPHTEILKYMASADVGTAFYRNTNMNNYYCASNKLYEFIALGKPVITNNHPGLLESVEQYQQGICLEQVNPEILAKSYARANDPKHVTPGAKKFFWEDEEYSLTQLYKS